MMDEHNEPIVLPAYTELDIEKVQTIDDIKLILGMLRIVVYDNGPDYEKVKHLLKTEE